MKKILFILFVLPVVAGGCKQGKGQSGIVGLWLIQSPYDGEMFISEQGEGSIVVYNSSDDTVFYREIFSFDVIDHSSSMDYRTNVRSHWYQAYMNDDIYCDFESTVGGDIVNEHTKRIYFNIGSTIDDFGQAAEIYNLDLDLIRD